MIYIHNGVEYQLLAIDGFWRVKVKGLVLSERFVLLVSAEAFAKAWIDSHEEG